MKKLLGILVLGLLWSGSAYASEDKDFYISCSAEGYYIMTYKNQRFAEILIDEYKITVGNLKLSEGVYTNDRRPISMELVNTNAKKPGVFFLYRNNFNKNITYSDKIIVTSEHDRFSDGGVKAYKKVTISLISGIYEIFYKDEVDIDDKVQFNAIGTCKGLVPILSYIENTSSKSSYLDYWWAVILIIAIAFFIFTQSGKRLKKIRRK